MKLLMLCFIMSLAVGCQTSAKKLATNESQTISDSNQERNAQSKNGKSAVNTNSASISQTVITKNEVAQKAVTIEDFAPKNWYLMMKAEGDLNGDGLPDAVAAFSKAKLFDGTDELTSSAGQSEADVNAERVLIVALRDAEGLLNLSELSQKIILCRTCGAQMDDTLLGLDIEKGAIEIRQGALGTSSVDYLHKIKKDSKLGWIVFYGEVENRYRPTGKVTKAKQRGAIALKNFDIAKESEKLDFAADSAGK